MPDGPGVATYASPGVTSGARAQTPNNAVVEDPRFECNVCLDQVHEPVVTLCGHLYCWPCLYRWLNNNHNACPVCKAGVTKDNVIPLYGRGTEAVDPRSKPQAQSGQDDVPVRPAAQRPEARQQTGVSPIFLGTPFGSNAAHFHGISFSAGFGFFPSLFGLQFQSFTPRPASQNGQSNNTAMTADEATQASLSRLLLLLGIITLGVLVFC